MICRPRDFRSSDPVLPRPCTIAVQLPAEAQENTNWSEASASPASLDVVPAERERPLRSDDIACDRGSVAAVVGPLPK